MLLLVLKWLTLKMPAKTMIENKAKQTQSKLTASGCHPRMVGSLPLRGGDTENNAKQTQFYPEPCPRMLKSEIDSGPQHPGMEPTRTFLNCTIMKKQSQSCKYEVDTNSIHQRSCNKRPRAAE